MRNTGIEIEVDINLIPEEIQELLDIEYSSKKGYDVLWIHDDGYKSFTTDLFQYMSAAKSVYNRSTKTDHLNLFIETTDILDENDKEVDGIKYKNIRF